ncbi:MAG: hypothetical protein C6H99_03630 [Epsilonproteobacteria bacterium]|nr:hypothetical protein [Campylobacterota bacterium]NPA64564.1 hypothetical protein [Campylobacterota bacterium]
MVLYIHGFKSCGWGEKSKALKAYFKDLLAPDLPIAPARAIRFLDDLIQKEPIDLLIGSSLGGYYATYLAQKHEIRAVLINPSTRPYRTLSSFVGPQRRFCDGEEFAWKEEYIQELLKFDTTNLKRGLFLVLLQTGDEVLDYQEALKKYSNQRRVVEYGGNHRFENIEDYLCMIKNFREGHGGHRTF